MRTSEVFILGVFTGAAVTLLWGREIQGSVQGRTRAVRAKAAEGIRAVETSLRAAEGAIRPAPTTGTA
jgi:hypothetical protein